jgi:phage replication-related protein YjqB (UPF0714/DUF867 family)
MPDTYENFEALAAKETSGVDYGTTGARVQLELSRGLRLTMFESLSREGRQHRKPRFDVFVKAVRRGLCA